MKYLGVLILTFLLSTTPTWAKDEKYITLPSNKNVRVIMHNEIEVPATMKMGRTYQFMYETTIPISDMAAVEQEAREILAYLTARLDSDFQTIYLRATGPYTGKMVTAKNGRDYKFSKESGSWELVNNN